MSSDYAIAKAQYVKARVSETRLKYSLMADAAVKRGRPEWEAEFDAKFAESQPQVLDLASELRRLTAGEPS